MRSVRWVITGLGVGVVGGFVGGLLSSSRPETRGPRAWLPDGPAVPVRELPAEDRLLPGNPQPVLVGQPVPEYSD
ncbi:hypothetical protein [Yinghuangia sp. YIM S09857]|uniref:hypothetical protein n=1 Tax=Yinghuangia sp. YIM S09857 TaxID=3436929 RepID=UPI003F536331